MKRNLVNMSNLHVGGGIQVATSVIAEAPKLARYREVSFLLSKKVKQNTETTGAALPGKMDVVDVFGIDPFNRSARRKTDAFDTVFTLFGPLYRLRPPFKSIVGFAQPWIIYPHNEVYDKLPLLQRLKTRLKFRIQALYFKRADALIVELEHVKVGLIRELGIAPERIHVVHNCLSSIYQDSSVWQDLSMPQADGYLKLGFLGRNYIHKNTGIFPKIAEFLEKSHGISARFYVTFTDEEWEACSPEFRNVCCNVGVLSAAQCPTFYKALDAVVFPSLLECFSATPLETLAMEVPLFASDRPFNRDVCHEHAYYFDPQSAESAANEIARIFSQGGVDKGTLHAGHKHALNFSSPLKRAEKYIDLITDEKANT